ncbi:MAG: radical SAM protein [Polyangiaceae bacterium]
MQYEAPVFRPPSEADAILLQATIGCSHNGCRFCGMYRHKQFRIKPLDRLRQDIATARLEYPNVGRVFLCDGDALAMPQAQLVAVLKAIREDLPNVIRVSTYANAKSIARKSDQDLAELRALNLKLFHMGLESGDDETLRRMEKHGGARFHVAQAERAHAANIKLFVTVLLGLGGRERTRDHARETARILTEMNPAYVGALSLMVIPGTPLYEDVKAKVFEVPSAQEMLLELRTLLADTEMHGIFYANHASNYLPIRARLPRDRAEALAQVESALLGRVPLTPEWMRGT